MILGIIPAAGKAERFGGVKKELLPIGDTTFLEKTIDHLTPYCDTVMVVTSLNKVHDHILYQDVILALQRDYQPGLWGAIRRGLEIEADYYYVLMPDTYIKQISPPTPAPFSMGMFVTDKPEKYGVLRENKIVDKMPGPSGWAWGYLAFSKVVRNLWLSVMRPDLPHAIDEAIRIFGLEKYVLNYYYDVGTLEGYLEVLDEHKSGRL